MKSVRMFILSALAMSFSVGGALADDLNPPPWRTAPAGQAPTTYQVWEFSTSANPAAPDIDLNPFGTATATMAYSTPFVPWKPDDFGHQGVWIIEDYIEFVIPNQPIENEMKRIWLQLTFYADGSGLPEIISDPLWSSVEMVGMEQIDDWYNLATFLITIEPNPESELIWLFPRDSTLYVDQVVIDTICVPEPATGLLALLAPVWFFARRRRV